MKTAQFYHTLEDGRLECLLCPHMCTPAEGDAGKCRVRRNVNGELISETYGKVSAVHYDPIEKKPLYHFYPGSIILSIGSVGCNLNCSFCQNCDISRADVSGFPWYKDYPVEDIINMAADYPNNIGIAFTYNEPTMSYEYIMEISRLASSMGMKTAMVSNGFINPDPLIRLLPFIDSFNIDLKAFRDKFYREHTNARLAPVMENLRILKTAEKHFEITNLVIPGLNDAPGVFTEMIDWISDELGENTVLHLSRYFPHHKMDRKPTPVQTLLDLYGIAKQKLHYVYLGNVASHDAQNTFCPECGELLINRSGYHTKIEGLDPDSHCKSCKTFIQNIVL
ncbi:MAG: AmmeMemoRadiSam system radical SAM enzyme [Bacteroidales bacterium]|nr:AmmeMemoRadiSam system radical SAM enzyme [Bacteroidales bacterium]